MKKAKIKYRFSAAKSGVEARYKFGRADYLTVRFTGIGFECLSNSKRAARIAHLFVQNRYGRMPLKEITDSLKRDFGDVIQHCFTEIKSE